MSIYAMSQVWAKSAHKGSGLLLMLAIADYANDEGSNAFPSVKTLGKKIRMTPRAVQQILRLLTESRELAISEGDGPSGTNRYRIIFENLGNEQAKKVVAGKEGGGENFSGGGDEPEVRGGMNGGSSNPSVEPSETSEEENKQKNGGPGYDVEPDDDAHRPPPGLSIPQLRRLLFPLFNLPAHHSPSRYEMDAELAADGKLADEDAPALVRWQKLPKDSKVDGANTRKKTYRSLLENLGEQVALATQAFPRRQASAPASPVAPPVVAAPIERTEDELQANHERAYRGKVRAGLVSGVAPEKADDVGLEIPPRPKLS